ncbi:MAG: glycosyltransferase family 39 protein, partial [Prolixibacteraceae bacterium]|nr:glycosyltransferase family 39 protein [Prolixibacteraceae bacterium]
MLLALWMYVPTLGLMELKSWDEAIYASISRTIFQTGDYLHLQYKGEPYFNKPPLFFYLTSWGYHLLGVNEFSSRIVSVLFGIACLILTYLFAKRLFSQNIGVIAVLLMLSNYHFFITVRHGRMESMVAFFIVLALYSFYRLMDDIKWIYAFALAIGLGVLTKGGMGLLPLLVIFPFLIFYPVWLKRMFSVHTLISIVLCLFMVLPWYLLQYQLYEAEYIRQFFDIQLVGRMKVAIEGHQGPWWYYLYRTSFYYFSNWSVLIFPGLVFIVWKSVQDKKPGNVLIAFFAWVILLLFSFGVETKLS